MAINAVKKLLQGDTPFTLTELGSGTVSSEEIAASAIVKDGLKYKNNVFSLKGDGTTNSATASVTITNGAAILGMYVTKLTSHANAPVFTLGTTSVLVSVVNALVGTDVCEGVIITIEP